MRSPIDLGMPQKFSKWREGQYQAVQDIVGMKERFFGQNAPTGSGKSLIYMSAGTLVADRYCILTATKALQSQLVKDFETIGLVEIKGRMNYPCLQPSFMTPDDSLCSLLSCVYDEDCPYKVALRQARAAGCVVTNYHYWMTAKEVLGDFDLLVLDEAHLSTTAIEDHLTVIVNLRKFSDVLGITVKRKSSWVIWLGEYYPILRALIKSLAGDRDLSNLREALPLYRTCQRLLQVAPHKHITQELRHGTAKVIPVFTSDHKDLLLHTPPKVLFTSATFHPKTAKQLGVSTIVKEYKSHFPVSRRPVYIVKGAPSISYSISLYDTMVWVRIIDQIIGARKDRKGLLHLSSYEWCKEFGRRTMHRDLFWEHEPKMAEMTVAAFKLDQSPGLLASPALSTGWDFPYDECRYQIIGKVPFPNHNDPVVAARKADDPEYPLFLAVQQLEQAAGRGMRAPDDYCETFIVDRNIEWLLRQHRGLFQRWFLESVKEVDAKNLPDAVSKKFLDRS